MRPRITLAALLACIVVAAVVVAALMFPSIRAARRQSEYRQAEAGLYAIRIAEHGFFDQDMDRNGVRDFWTRDVRGLAQFGLLAPEIVAADGAYPDARTCGGHFFAMVDRVDGKLSSEAGVGPMYAICMYPASSAFPRTYVLTFLGFYGRANGGARVREWPVGDGTWAIID